MRTGREYGHAPGHVTPGRPGADARRLGGLRFGQAHACAERDGLPLPDWKSARRGGPGFSVQVADGRRPGARRSLRGGAAVRGRVPAYRPRPVHDRLAQLHARRAGVRQAAPLSLQGGELVPHDGSGRGGVTVQQQRGQPTRAPAY
jgi:hypothetical protein